MRHGKSSLIVLLPAFVALACGGGGDGGGGFVPESPGGSSNLAASFSPDQPDPGALDVSMSPENASGSMINVWVEATGVSDIFGASFDVVFDPSAVEFVNWSPGSFFELGGDNPRYTLAAQPGRLVVSVTRSSGAAGGVGTFATRAMIQLTFRVTQPGSTRVTLENASLEDSGTPPMPIPGLTWYGGALNGN